MWAKLLLPALALSLVNAECTGKVCEDEAEVAMLQTHRQESLKSLKSIEATKDDREDDGDVWLTTYEKDGDACEFAALCVVTTVSGQRVREYEVPSSFVTLCANEDGGYDHITSDWRSGSASRLDEHHGLDHLKNIAPWVGKTSTRSSEDCLEDAYSNRQEMNCYFYANTEDKNKRCYG